MALRTLIFSILFSGFCIPCKSHRLPDKSDVLSTIHLVNKTWQRAHPNPGNAFWDVAAYHSGNMEAYKVTNEQSYKDYSMAWAEKNLWMGARSTDSLSWKYTYGETDEHVLFGDWQICFQTYIDLYNLEPDPQRIARALQVMGYEMRTPNNDYWWWADGLYMVMPVMTKLYKVTGDTLYTEKLHEYFSFAKKLMYDEDSHLFYRDAKYIYPKHASTNGLKDFWARGDGWVFAALAKVLQDLPQNDKYRAEYILVYREMAKAIADAQQKEGYWTRSLLDPHHAPGYETSGTAFFTYGFLWGINNNLLEKKTYLPVALKGWKYLTKIALQPSGVVGYVQPIGEKAIPGQTVDQNSQSCFGVGAFLLAASEMTRML